MEANSLLEICCSFFNLLKGQKYSIREVPQAIYKLFRNNDRQGLKQHVKSRKRFRERGKSKLKPIPNSLALNPSLKTNSLALLSPLKNEP